MNPQHTWTDRVRRRSTLYSIIRFILNPGLRLYCLKRNKYLKAFQSGEMILNIGSGGVRFKKKVITLDSNPSLQVDVLADARQLPFKDNSFGAVLMESLLEHVREPEKVIEETLRVLKKGGKVFVEVPFMYPYHSAPYDFRRYTLQGLEEALCSFRKLDSGVDIGATGTLCSALRGFVATLFSFNIGFLYQVLFWLTGLLTFPLKFLDLFLAANRQSHHVASALFYIGEK